MRTVLLAVVLMAVFPAFAQTTALAPASAAASEASIRELLQVTNGKAVLEGAWGQLDGMMDKAMKDAIGDKPVTDKQQKILAEFRADTIELIRSVLTWEKLEPMYIKLYQDTFSQAELEGMLAFYKTDAGKAVTAKQPQLTQALMGFMMTLMQDLMPRIRALSSEYVEKLKAAG